MKPITRRRFAIATSAALVSVPSLLAADRPKTVIGISVLTLTNPFFIENSSAIIFLLISRRHCRRLQPAAAGQVR
ncbi:MAG: hypothetical protein WCH93_06210, partial [Actinomycetota bacterium]